MMANTKLISEVKKEESAGFKGLKAGLKFAEKLNRAAGVFDPFELARREAKRAFPKLGTLAEKLAYEKGFRDSFRWNFDKF